MLDDSKRSWRTCCACCCRCCNLAACLAVLLVVLIMDVWPEETEVALITRDHFDLIDGPFAVKYFEGGYGAVYSPRKGS